MTNFNYDASDEPIENTACGSSTGNFNRHYYRYQRGKITEAQYFSATAIDLTEPAPSDFRAVHTKADISKPVPFLMGNHAPSLN